MCYCLTCFCLQEPSKQAIMTMRVYSETRVLEQTVGLANRREMWHVVRVEMSPYSMSCQSPEGVCSCNRGLAISDNTNG